MSKDGVSFYPLGKVAASGFGKYKYIHNKPLNALNYYRLKIIDKDGHFEYSPTRTVNNMAAFNVAIFPNPVEDQLNLRIESGRKQNLLIEISSADGKVLVVIKQTVTNAPAFKSLNISSLQRVVISSR